MANFETDNLSSKSYILVTGGAGYIGSITVNELIKAGYDVVVLDSLENGHKEAVNPKAALEVVDLEDKVATDAVFKKYKITAVVDFAAYLAVGESMENPVKYMTNNVMNFINLLEVMNSNDCRFIIKSSTASVYGEPTSKSDLPLREEFTDLAQLKHSRLLAGKWNGEEISGDKFFDAVIKYFEQHVDRKLRLTKDELTKLKVPFSIYGLTKLIDELILNKYNKMFGIKSVVLRYFNVCGADPSCLLGEDKPTPTNLMTVAVLKACGKIPELKVFGNDYPTKDGTGVRDYIHVNDLANGHVKALQYLLQSKQSNTFNLGTSIGYTVLEVINAVEKAAGQKIEYKIVERRPGDPAEYFADPSKANITLGWKTQYSLDDMARTAWNWHSSHPNGYKK
ncbi:MAG: UDP-glucose 4-epimerase [Candidatus Berkelbacteria bacterium]